MNEQVTIPADLHERLKEFTDATGADVDATVANLIEDFLAEEWEDQPA